MNLRENIDRLQREIKITSPKNPKQIIDELFNINLWLVRGLVQSNTIEEFIKIDGNNSLEELYGEDWGFEGDSLKQVIELTRLYYQTVPPNSCKIIENEDSIVGFKTVTLVAPGSDVEDTYILATKW